MDIMGSVISAGAVVLGVALMTFAVGKTLTSLPIFKGDPNSSQMEWRWNTTMVAVSTNSQTAFNILSVSPLILGAAIIIAILVGAFVVYRATQ